MERAGDFLIDSIADAVAVRLSKMTNCTRRLMSLEDTALYLGMSEDAVRDLMNQGRLKPVRPTRRLQFDVRDLDDFIDELKRNK